MIDHPHFLRRLVVGCLVVGAAAGAMAQSSYTTPYTATTFAGDAGDPGATNGTGGIAQFGYPEGVAVDSSGNVYVADTENDMIREITTAGAVSTLSGTALVSGSANGPAASALFNYPTGIAVDSSGNVYVADTSNNMIRKITPTVSGGSTTWAVTTLAGTVSPGHADGTGTAASFSGPQGIGVDSSGNIYVADEGNRTIRKVTSAGVVTTFAGTVDVTGSANGTGTGAQFNEPEGVAVDSSGNIFVADTGNNTIRMITPAGVVTTLAGLASSPYGSADGTGSAARFYTPIGIAVDSADNIYVADTFNDTIRKVTLGGVVSTLAGQVQVTGSQDGTGGAAEFYEPFGITVDSSGNVYIADTANATIRKAVGSGTSSTVTITTQPKSQSAIAGGSVTFTVVATGPSSISYQWQFNGGAIAGATSSSYTVSPVGSGNTGTYTVVVTSGGTITSNPATLTIASPPTVSNPASQTVNAGATVTFSVTATGGSLAYQWYFNGASIANATTSTLALANVGTEQGGYYSVGVSNGAGAAISSNALLTVNYSARLVNLSSRANVGTGGNILISGFGIGGTGSKNLLLRGVGPQLTFGPFYIANALAHPQLTLFDSGSAPGESAPEAIVSNTGWGNAFTLGPSSVQVSPQSATAAFMNSVGAFPLNSGSADSALKVTPTAGDYSCEITGVGGTTGVALAEIYDADAVTATARLVNISARADVGVGANILIGGFVIAGTTPETVLIRAVGPGLSAVLSGTLSVPQLNLFDGGNLSGESAPEIIATNIGWGSNPTLGVSPVQAGIQPATATEMTSVGASPLTAGSADCAMIATLPPGDYTAEVSGVGSTTGIALVEIYEFP